MGTMTPIKFSFLLLIVNALCAFPSPVPSLFNEIISLSILFYRVSHCAFIGAQAHCNLATKLFRRPHLTTNRSFEELRHESIFSMTYQIQHRFFLITISKTVLYR